MFKNEALELPAQKIFDRISRTILYHETGRIVRSRGILFEGVLPGAAIGSVVSIARLNESPVKAEVVGFSDKNVLLMPVGEGRGISTSSRLQLISQESTVLVGEQLLGSILDGNGQPMDGSPLPEGLEERGIYADPPKAIDREPISQAMTFGIRALDGFLTVGKGQRIGVFSGSGVGKSTLLGMIAKYCKADVNVIALVGERGRELREFVERDLGREGLARSVVVCATSDKSPLLRMRSAYVATTIAEYFRDQGKHVLLMMDSVTRFAMAQREIGLSSGEPPSSKGYTPSVFSEMPKLLERAGVGKKGSITGVYAVLVDQDDMDDPIADSVRSTIDGHIILSRKLAERNHYPPIDVLASVSRVMNQVVRPEHRAIASNLRDLLSTFREAEDLVNVGAYVRGANPHIDLAIDVSRDLGSFLKQGTSETQSMEETIAAMMRILRSHRQPMDEEDDEE